MIYGDAVVIDGAELSLSVLIDPGEISTTNMLEDGPESFMPIMPDAYEGPFEVEPSPDMQVLATSGLVVPENIIIKPIPSNYGLITWDGNTLTVS